MWSLQKNRMASVNFFFSLQSLQHWSNVWIKHNFRFYPRLLRVYRMTIAQEGLNVLMAFTANGNTAPLLSPEIFLRLTLFPINR